MKILVTPRSLTRAGDPALDLLREAGMELVFSTPGKQPDEQELLRLLPGCAGYLAGVEKITERVLESASDLKVISRYGVGIDNIDLEAAKRKGIEIRITVGANARGVAELAITLLLAGTRFISWSDRLMKAGEWQRKKGIEVHGRTLGVIGCGRIGRITAELAMGLGMNVLAYDMYPDDTYKPRSAGGDRTFTFTAIEELYRRADCISLHCPPAEDGSTLINAESIGLMKEGVYIVNTARAALVDEEDLFEALEAGRVSGYAVDVFETEPPDASPLLSHENVITTPHIGGLTRESAARMARSAVANILEKLS